MKIVTVVGARPQFVKAAVVSKALTLKGDIREVIVHTGQHYDDMMSGVFFRELGIPQPDYNLAIGSAGQGVQTGRMMAALEPVMQTEKPDIVIVYGDTNSTMAGALVAAKLHIPIAHVEAGLRSFNATMPEEINRVVTDHVSRWLFAPTDEAVSNLLREGFPDDRIRQVGDVMYDAAITYADDSRADGLLCRFGVTAGGYVLATIHRAENTDSALRLRQIIDALTAVSRSVPVVFPAHPRTLAALEREGISVQHGTNLKFVDTLGYVDMIALEKHARTIVTDSGGVQKEAFFFRVPCVIVRAETEWVEIVRLGGAVLVPPSGIADAVSNSAFRVPEIIATSIYGGGQASHRIAHDLLELTGPR
jgi:UDP-GlcNAc3NAcA epimerase